LLLFFARTFEALYKKDASLANFFLFIFLVFFVFFLLFFSLQDV